MIHLKRELGLFSSTLLVAGNMIGIGIFVTAGRIYSLLPHPFYILLAWLIGGLLSLAGGLVYAELGSRFPMAGGGYVFLSKTLGPLWGFLAGLSSICVTVPGTAAFLAIGITKYLGITDPWIAKPVGIVAIGVLSWINYRGVMRGAWLQDGFMLVKLSLIVGLLLAGFLSPYGSWSHFMVSSPLKMPVIAAFFLALVPVMFTFSGWDATAFVAGEVKNPRRTLPFSMVFGTLGVLIVYGLLAALYIYAIPVTQFTGHMRIVTAVSTVLFGTQIGKIAGIMVAISVLGCLSAAILLGPRVIFAMAKDRYLPSFAAEVHPRFFTPANAIVLNAVIASCLLITGTFEYLLNFVTVPTVFFSALNGIGLIWLRLKVRKDDVPSVYSVFGYPIVPLLFIVGMMGIVVNTSFKDPYHSLMGLMMVIGVGVPFYYGIQRKARRSTHSTIK